MYAKVFEVQTNNATTFGNLPSLINAVKNGCAFRVGYEYTHDTSTVQTSNWDCNAISSFENITHPQNSNVICNTYQFAGGNGLFNAGWPESANFRTNFYSIGVNPSEICTTDFLIYQPKVFGGIDNSCSAANTTWYTDPICYYLSQTGKAPEDLAGALAYIEEGN